MDAISRRKFFGFGLGAATLGAAPFRLSPLALAAPAPSLAALTPDDNDNFFTSIADAFAFQNMMMDAYATGERPA